MTGLLRGKFAGRLLGVAATLLMFGQPALATGGATSMLTQATRMSANDYVVGTLAQSTSIHVVVALKLRNKSQLDALVADPHHPILTPAQFAQTYSPSPAQAAAVADFLRQSGFTNVQIASNRLLVSADGSAGTAQTAFSTQLMAVQTHDGRSAYANTTAIRIPVALQPTVNAVLGLQSVHVMHTFARRVTINAMTPLAVTGHNPTEFPAIYGDTGVPVASGVTVGIITEGDMTNVKSDLNLFTTNNSLSTVTVQEVDTGTPSTDTTGDDEWDLDSQDIVGMAGGQVGKLILYTIPSLSNSNLTADIDTIVTDDAAKIINVSLGECETYTLPVAQGGDGSAAAQDALFEQAVAQGQTFSVSSGDSGADECSDGGITPSWPASSQYVVAVGGTSLDASTTTWNSEVVWNDSSTSSGSTGGSPSTFEPMPSWQQNVGQNTSSSYRGVPDIAYDADPYSGALVVVDGTTNNLIGGTSLAAPLFAGAWARIIQAEGTDVGFAAPLLYQRAGQSSGYFHDVTSGNNIYNSTAGATLGETAAAGWDYTTGWGSLIVSQMLAVTANAETLTAFANQATSVTLSGTPSSGNTVASYSIVAQPSHGTLTAIDSSTGAYTYTPANGYYGTDSFTFKVTDSSGMFSFPGTESVTVDAQPTASAGSVHTSENAPVNGKLHATDPDSSTLTYSIDAPPANGSVSITNATTGAFTYTPNSSYTGSDSFTFKATDSSGYASAAAVEQVTVSAPGSGGGGALNPVSLLVLALLALLLRQASHRRRYCREIGRFR